jgi:hypothetical protein
MYPPVPAGLQWVVPPSEAIEISGCEVAPGLSVVLSPVTVIPLPVYYPTHIHFPIRP